MRIVHIAPELAPAAKIGGLADVVAGLSRQQRLDGHDVFVIIPKYDCLDYSHLTSLRIAWEGVPTWYDGMVHYNTVWQAEARGTTTYLIEGHDPLLAFKRGRIYGCGDDTDRFTYFCRAVLESLKCLGLEPDILHLHDWTAAACGPLFDVVMEGQMSNTRRVLTLHNVQHQGRCGRHVLDRVGLNASYHLHPDRLLDDYDPDTANLLKGGVVYSDQVVAVSPRYAQEILSPIGGCGLHNTLSKYSYKLRGILNGLDYSYWDPAIDPLLPYTYRAGGRGKGKARCKATLQEQMGLEPCDRPLVGSVTRLVPQKGIELIRETLCRALDKEAQFCLVGSSPIPEIQQQFTELHEELWDNPHVSLCLQPTEQLAHLVYAASDMLVVPSLFEPCGLTQLIAMRYGTVPVVRRTGGLADTIRDMEEVGPEKPNGFCFDHPDPAGVHYALDRAIETWYSNRRKWNGLVNRGLKDDHSWQHAAEEYEQAYCAAIQN